jgi:hypothetical protein
LLGGVPNVHAGGDAGLPAFPAYTTMPPPTTSGVRFHVAYRSNAYPEHLVQSMFAPWVERTEACYSKSGPKASIGMKSPSAGLGAVVIDGKTHTKLNCEGDDLMCKCAKSAVVESFTLPPSTVPYAGASVVLVVLP